MTATQPSYTFPSGKREFLAQGTSTGRSDDRGEYRARGIRPGNYYVRADINFWASESQIYYPGVKDPAGAIPVTVRETELKAL